MKRIAAEEPGNVHAPGCLRRTYALALVLVMAFAPPARAAGRATVSAYADRDGISLESPQTNAAGLSEWAKICTLPCERLHVDPSLPYRVTGPTILPSEPFLLLPIHEPQLMTVHAKTPSDLGRDRWFLYGGLAGVLVGAALLVPGVILVGQGCSSPMEGPCMMGTGFALAGAGILTALIGGALAITGGVALSNCNTTVSLETGSPGVTR